MLLGLQKLKAAGGRRSPGSSAVAAVGVLAETPLSGVAILERHVHRVDSVWGGSRHLQALQGRRFRYPRQSSLRHVRILSAYRELIAAAKNNHACYGRMSVDLLPVQRLPFWSISRSLRSRVSLHHHQTPDGLGWDWSLLIAFHSRASNKELVRFARSAGFSASVGPVQLRFLIFYFLFQVDFWEAGVLIFDTEASSSKAHRIVPSPSSHRSWISSWITQHPI